MKTTHRTLLYFFTTRFIIMLSILVTIAVGTFGASSSIRPDLYMVLLLCVLDYFIIVRMEYCDVKGLELSELDIQTLFLKWMGREIKIGIFLGLLPASLILLLKGLPWVNTIVFFTVAVIGQFFASFLNTCLFKYWHFFKIYKNEMERITE